MQREQTDLVGAAPRLSRWPDISHGELPSLHSDIRLLGSLPLTFGPILRSESGHFFLFGEGCEELLLRKSTRQRLPGRPLIEQRP
ncbi:hypothetical protein VTK56DRAFT_8461 [Thermocarpiscus australiensis]